MKPTPKGRFLTLYSVMISCRKAPPEFRFASSTLRNFVPSGAAHEAAAGHALTYPSDNSSSLFRMQEADPFLGVGFSFLQVIIYQFTPVMSSVVETSLKRFLHSLRSVKMTVSVNMSSFPFYMYIYGIILLTRFRYLCPMYPLLRYRDSFRL